MATSTRPGARDLAREREDLGPLAGRGAQRGEPSAPRSARIGQVGQGLHVVDDRGLAEQAAHGGERGPRTRHAAAALDAVDQGRLLAAHERPGPHLDVDFQAEPLPRMFSPSRSLASACAIATLSRLIASGYSARM